MVTHKQSLFFFFFIYKSLLLACPTHTNPPGLGLGTGGILFDKHIYKVNSYYLLHNEAGSNTQHIFFLNGTFKDVAGSSTQPIFFTMNPSPLTFAVNEFLLFFRRFFLSFLFCFVWCFLVDKINVRSCVRPIATTRQTPVVEKAFLLIFFFFFFLNLYCKHVPLIQTLPARDLAPEAFFLINTFIKVNSYIFFTMRLEVAHSISSS